MLNSQLRDIEFEKINDEYCYGQYAKFKVVMMRKNGYINATKMCGDISEIVKKKKQFIDWKRTQNAKDLINELSASTGIPVDTFDMTPCVENKLRGTYVHPDLIPHIASWASPKFAIKVSKIVNEYYNTKERRKHKQELDAKNDKIDELMEKLDKQHAESQKKIDKLLHKNKKIAKKLSIVKEQNDDLLDKVDKISEDRVVNAPDELDKHVFIVMRDDSENAERSKRYYAIRTKRRTSKNAIKKYKLEHENARILINIEYNPNGINLWDRIKAKLKSKIRIRVNYYGLRNNYTEEQMINDINELNDEKYDD